MQDYPILSVSYDKTKGDIPCLMVGTFTVDNAIIVMNTIIGEEADTLWQLLVGGEYHNGQDWPSNSC